jgi:hypothetical protein
VQVTVVWPFGKTLPEAGTQVTGNEAPDWSVAVTVKLTVVPFAPVHSTEKLFGQTMTGGQLPAVSTGAAVAISLPDKPAL